MTKLRLFDQVSARRVDYFIAGSKNAQKRIEKIYQREAEVVYPFIEEDRFEGIESFNGNYMVIIGRPSKYKRFDLVQKACQKLGLELKIITGGLPDELVVNILAGCKALIIAGEEDFGISSLEAQALGKGVIAFKAGGALETVKPGKTGVFFDEQTEESLSKAIIKFDSIRIKPEDCKANADIFTKERFKEKFKTTVASLVYTKYS